MTGCLLMSTCVLCTYIHTTSTQYKQVNIIHLIKHKISHAPQRHMDRGWPSPQWQLETSNPTYGLPSAKVTNTICASCSKLFPLSLYFHDFSESHSYRAMPTATPPIVTRAGFCVLCWLPSSLLFSGRGPKHRPLIPSIPDKCPWSLPSISRQGA